MFDVGVMLVFTVVGLLMRRFGYSPVAFVSAIVLGPLAENAFRQSMLMSQGTLPIFYANGLVGTFTTIALLLLFWPLISKAFAVLRGRTGRH